MNCSSCDFSAILPEEIEAEMKEAAEVSMGTEVSDIDIENIKYLCDQVCLFFISLSQIKHYDARLSADFRVGGVFARVGYE